jgi:hypothetical protein
MKGVTRPAWLPKLATLSAAAGAALVLAGVAAADKEKIQLTKAGNAAARATILKRADFGTATGWSGGAKKPDLSSESPCKNFAPKQSDLVLIGAAESVWRHTGLQFDSESQVLKTPAMVALDWKRTVLAPEVEPCLRSTFVKQLGSTGRLTSFGRLGFPKLATYSRAYRAIVDVKSGTTTVKVMFDVVLVGRGRTEITLTVSAPYAAEPVVSPAEVRLARLLVSRVRM